MIPGTDRPLPHRPEHERALVGAILAHGRAALDAVSIRPEAFFLPAARLVTETALALADEGADPDLIALSDRLRSNGSLEEAGGIAGLMELSAQSPGTLEALANLVSGIEEDAARRLVISEAFTAAERAYDPTVPPAEILSSLAGIGDSGAPTSYARLGDAAPAVLAEVQLLRKGASSSGQVMTGFTDMDEMLRGFRPGQLAVIAGRPGSGKTALALNICERCGAPVGFFSLEMGREELFLRMACQVARLSSEAVEAGRLTAGEWRRFEEALGAVVALRIFVEDTGGLTLSALRREARRMVRREGCRLIVVDYIQLVRNPNPRRSREQEVAEVSASAKAMAKELGVPVLMLAQLNREAEGTRPSMRHLRESGAIEQDADKIILLYRPPDTEAAAPTEAIVAKQRNGRTGVVRLSWLPECTRFEDWSPISDEDVADAVRAVPGWLKRKAQRRDDDVY